MKLKLKPKPNALPDGPLSSRIQRRFFCLLLFSEEKSLHSVPAAAKCTRGVNLTLLDNTSYAHASPMYYISRNKESGRCAHLRKRSADGEFSQAKTWRTRIAIPNTVLTALKKANMSHTTPSNPCGRAVANDFHNVA